MYTVTRIVAIIAVFAGACIGWVILGATTSSRTASQGARLGPEVQSLWGQAQRQTAPTFTFRWKTSRIVERSEEGEDKRRRLVRETVWDDHQKAMLPASTQIDADIRLDQRLKGLLWYSLYDAVFDGRWRYEHDDINQGTLDLAFSFPAPDAMYDDFRFVVDGRDVAHGLRPERGAVSVSLPDFLLITGNAIHRWASPSPRYLYHRLFRGTNCLSAGGPDPRPKGRRRSARER